MDIYIDYHTSNMPESLDSAYNQTVTKKRMLLKELSENYMQPLWEKMLHMVLILMRTHKLKETFTFLEESNFKYFRFFKFKKYLIKTHNVSCEFFFAIKLYNNVL